MRKFEYVVPSIPIGAYQTCHPSHIQWEVRNSSAPSDVKLSIYAVFMSDHRPNETDRPIDCVQ